MPLQSIDELKQVSGVGPAAIGAFREAGYETLADLDGAAVDDVTEVPGIGTATAEAILAFVTEQLADDAGEAEDTGDEESSEEEQATVEDSASSDVNDAETSEDGESAEEPAPAMASDAGGVEDVSSQSHDAGLQQIAEQLSAKHLTLLRVFHDPRRWAHTHEKEYPSTPFLRLSTVVEHAVPEWRQNQADYDQLWRDLYRYNLVTIETLHVMTSRTGAMSGRTSELGEELLAFIDSD